MEAELAPAGAAYGFSWRFGSQLDGLGPPDESLPEVLLSERPRQPGERFPDVSRLEDTRALVALGAAFAAEVTRAPACVRVVSSGRAAEQLVHPILSRPASLLARWRGDEAFHAGAFVLGDGAWGVLGPRGAGKSTLMALLLRRGLTVLTDDLLVVRDGRALMGPRVADLRLESAEMLGVLGGDSIRAGERRRVPLGPSPASLPLRGWLVLRWGAYATTRLPVETALRRIVAERLWNTLAGDDRHVLSLASAPIVVFSRPRDWASSEQSVGLLLETLAAG